MTPEAENKMVDPQVQKADDPGRVTMKTVGILRNEYHFAGVPHWKPFTVVATTLKEAIDLWKQHRKPAQETTPPPQESQPAPQTPSNESPNNNA